MHEILLAYLHFFALFATYSLLVAELVLLLLPAQPGRWRTLSRLDIGYFIGAIAVLATGLWVRLGWHGFAGGPRVPAFDWLTDKKDLAPARLLHALALAWLVAAFVPREAGWMHFLTMRWVAAIGRNSLQVFCVGLFLSWGASVVFRLLPYSARLDVALIGVGFVVLGLFAWWRERRLAIARVAVAA